MGSVHSGELRGDGVPQADVIGDVRVQVSGRRVLQRLPRHRQREQIAGRIKAEVDEAVEYAEAAPPTDPESALTGVYAEG